MAKPWRTEEENYLHEQVGKLKVETIATNLNKTITAVDLKMKRLYIGNTKEQTGMITMGELASTIGVDRKTVENWVENHELPCQRKKTRHVKTFYFIDSNLFWKWALHHQERIDFSKIEPHSLPPEPKWVDKLRYTERKVKGNYYRQWTKKEESLIFQLRENGEKYKDIAEIVNRTPISVERKYKRLKKEIQKNK